MTDIDQLKTARLKALEMTVSGAPERPSNPFFGVGPITDATIDEVDSRIRRLAFDQWIEKTYRKLDDKGNDIGGFTTAEIGRSMHRGYPADKILLDMMRTIHRYFEFPKSHGMAVGLGGGHSGFTVCIQHLMNANDRTQRIYVDTPRPESDDSTAAGFFRQSWATQILELQRFAPDGDEARIHFAQREGEIPSAAELKALGISIFVGVGHETTGANTYRADELRELLNWIKSDPENHHAVLDATSMLGAMPWEEDLVRDLLDRCCLFTPFQKAVGGISGYFVASFTPQALALVARNQQNPSWAIPRQFKLAPPVDPRKPISSKQSLDVGPFYDPVEDRMIGGVINTYSTLAFAETTFGLLQSESRIGSVGVLHQRSLANRAAISQWVDKHPLFSFAVSDPECRGAAVFLLKIEDSDIVDDAIHARIIARSKQLMGYEGITHPNGVHETGLDAGRYLNAFPGMPGDYRAWIGGIRTTDDVLALLENLQYAYLRAKIVVLEEELARSDVQFEPPALQDANRRVDDPDRAYKVLIVDHLGLRPDSEGNPDSSEIRRYIEQKGGRFYKHPVDSQTQLDPGHIHFFYQPQLSTAEDILGQSSDAQYDAVIAAATIIPTESVFREGGVRIGAGTGNMLAASWGGGNGEGGVAPLMNTPGINSRATAQMVMKAVLKVAPDLPVDELHRLVSAGQFDTGRDLPNYPTSKLEGKRFAVLGYGNIGREVAKLAKAFGMRVAIYARDTHRHWIESEGYEFAQSPLDAARNADFLSVHIGLGRQDAVTSRYANAGMIDKAVLGAMNSEAILVNYDRGEVVDLDALDWALETGQIRYAAIDADLFTNKDTGARSGPMVPYLPLLEKYADRLELLPHAAADTDHPSRVAGAKQAVDQIYDAIQFKLVRNAKGSVPEGYTDGGSLIPAGVGRVGSRAIASLVENRDALKDLRQISEKLAAILGALDATCSEKDKQELISRYSRELVASGNRQKSLFEAFGLYGPAGED